MADKKQMTWDEVTEALRSGLGDVNSLADLGEAGQLRIKVSTGGRTVQTTLGALVNGGPDERRRLFRELMPIPSAETLENMANLFREMGKQTAAELKKVFDELQQAAGNIQRVRPYMDVIFAGYPDDSAWYLNQPIGVIMAPVSAYMQDRGLDDGTDIAAHKADFLAFFQAYSREMETVLKKDPAADLEAALHGVFDKLAAAGLLKADRAPVITRTVYPLTLIAPIDKVSKKAFAGELTEQLQPLAMERRESKRQVTTLASINFSAPQLQGLKGLTMYDRSVYNAICTLYIRGGNEYITPQMIYQVMTGKEESYLNPKQAAEISSSITKFMYGGIRIDATDEVNKHHISGSLVYDTNLLHAERVKRNLNGTIAECIRIIKTPVLYEYASSKDQIGSAPIAALATPINKNSDTLALQAYLLERIFAMRGTDPQRDIAYSSIYSAIWGKESSSTKGPQSGYSRLKKSRLRESAVKMLEYWTTAGTAKDGGSLIKGFCEYKRGKTIAGVTISL